MKRVQSIWGASSTVWPAILTKIASSNGWNDAHTHTWPVFRVVNGCPPITLAWESERGKLCSKFESKLVHWPLSICASLQFVKMHTICEFIDSNTWTIDIFFTVGPTDLDWASAPTTWNTMKQLFYPTNRTGNRGCMKEVWRDCTVMWCARRCITHVRTNIFFLVWNFFGFSRKRVQRTPKIFYDSELLPIDIIFFNRFKIEIQYGAG